MGRPYRYLIEEPLRDGGIPLRDGRLEYLEEYDLIRAREKVLLTYPQKKKKRVKKEGKVVEEYWQDYEERFEFEPGIVYHFTWKNGAEWENEEWQNWPEEKLRERWIFRKNSRFSVEKIERIKDLDAAIRQSLEHKITRLIGTVIKINNKEKFFLPGEAKRMADLSKRLDEKGIEYKRAIETQEVTSELTAKTIEEFTRYREMLERVRSGPKLTTRQEIDRGIQAKPLEVPIFTSRASAAAWERVVQILDMVINIVKEGEKRMKCRDVLVRKAIEVYTKLAETWLEIEENLQLARLPVLGGGVDGARIYLTEAKEASFKPYFDRIRDPAFQRLRNVPKHAQERDARAVQHSIENALSKLVAIVKYEKVPKAELLRKKELFIKKGLPFPFI